jgi:hypothetical protein
MTTLWIATIGASVLCYLLKLSGFLIPNSLLSNPVLVRINELIPVVLLSSLVSIQSLASKTEIVVDHRLGGVLAAFIALRLRASFPIMMIAAAITSALIHRSGI